MYALTGAQDYSKVKGRLRSATFGSWLVAHGRLRGLRAVKSNFDVATGSTSCVGEVF